MLVRIIFILSSWHSGSTWIGYVLGSTPMSAYVGEFHRPWDAPERRVPCTMCAARGLAECTVLHGADAQPVVTAFDFAARRTGRDVVVDNSKLPDWIARFRGRADLDVRVLHVVKDPRGWFASARRRGDRDLAASIAAWCAENRQFHDLTRGFGQAGMTVSYDLLAAAPLARFRPVFAWCGLPFSAAALRYWECQHHAFAANGATDAVIRAANVGVPPAHFATGDDAFYARNSRRQFHDDRWRAALTASEQATIHRDPAMARLLSDLGLRLTASGVADRRRFLSLRRWGGASRAAGSAPNA